MDFEETSFGIGGSLCREESAKQTSCTLASGSALTSQIDTAGTLEADSKIFIRGFHSLQEFPNWLLFMDTVECAASPIFCEDPCKATGRNGKGKWHFLVLLV